MSVVNHGFDGVSENEIKRMMGESKYKMNKTSKDPIATVNLIEPGMNEKQYTPIQIANDSMFSRMNIGSLNRNSMKIGRAQRCRSIVTAFMVLGLSSLLLLHVLYINNEMKQLREYVKELSFDQYDIQKTLMKMQAYVEDNTKSLAGFNPQMYQSNKKSLEQVNSEVDEIKESLDETDSEMNRLKNMQIFQLYLADTILGKQRETDKKITDDLKGTEKKLDDVSLALIKRDSTIFGKGLDVDDEPESPSMNGTILWKISNYSQMLSYAKLGVQSQIYSDTFYTSENGYAMYLAAYPNGHHETVGTHLSIYFHLRKGKMDEFLTWPFTYKFTITLIDPLNGDNNIVKSLVPDPSTLSFMKPNSKWTFGYGWSDFVSNEELENGNYSKSDELYIKAVVERM